jgi:cytochrome c
MSDLRTNTILGLGLASMLLIMALRISGEDVFHPTEPAKPGYGVDISAVIAGGGGGAAPEQEGPVDWGTVLKDPSLVAQGQKISAKCQSCHNFEKGGPNMTGPNLYGVVGRTAGTHPGFNYSPVMKAYGQPWTFDNINKFVSGPQKDLPGVLMTFIGLKNQADRTAIIAYLRSLSDAPVPLPPPLPPAAKAPASSAPASAAPAKH